MNKLSETQLENLTTAVNQQLKAWQGFLAPEVSAVQVEAVLEVAQRPRVGGCYVVVDASLREDEWLLKL